MGKPRRIEDTSTGIDQQGVRDAMLLAPSPGEVAAGSVDAKLDDILEGINTLRPAAMS